MSEKEFKAFCSLFMASDPWPGTDEEHEILLAWADKQAQAFGWETWIEAFHLL